MLNETRYHQGFVGIITFFPCYFLLLFIFPSCFIDIIFSMFKLLDVLMYIDICCISFPGEYRYKKLLCTVDLTKDFFFSYSYHVMRSLQKNLCDNKTEELLYDTMFVWNEFLTRGIRNNLKNTLWTVALVYGFFKQVWNVNLIYLYRFSLCLYNCSEPPQPRRMQLEWNF